jgi:hypothetical protein
VVSSTNKTDRHDITEILLKVALNTIKQTTYSFKSRSGLCYAKGILRNSKLYNRGHLDFVENPEKRPDTNN